MAEAQPAVLTKNHTKDLQMEGAVPSDSEKRLGDGRLWRIGTSRGKLGTLGGNYRDPLGK
jgi:hypothetical protein